jgi:hypothetical protein
MTEKIISGNSIENIILQWRKGVGNEVFFPIS